MKRINSGYFSAAYYSTDGSKVILFSIDPLKETMCQYANTTVSVHVPIITKIGEETKYQDTITIYRMEKLVPLSKFSDKRETSVKRDKVVDDYFDLDSELFQCGMRNGKFLPRMNIYDKFYRWMERIENIPHLAKYEEVLIEQFEFLYEVHNDELAFDFHDGNLSVRPYHNDLIFNDNYGLRYLCDNDYFRIARNYPNKLLQSIYTE